MDLRNSTRLSYWRNAGRTFIARSTGDRLVPLHVYLVVGLVGGVLVVRLPSHLHGIGMAILLVLLGIIQGAFYLRHLQRLNVDPRATIWWDLRWYYGAKLLFVTPLAGFALIATIETASILNPWFVTFMLLRLGLFWAVEYPHWKKHTILVLRRFGAPSTDTFGRLVFPVAKFFGRCVTLAERELRSSRVRLGDYFSPLSYVVISEASRWQSVVTHYLGVAEVVILDYTTPSPAVEWELRAASEQCPNKLLVICRESYSHDGAQDFQTATRIDLQDRDETAFQASLAAVISSKVSQK